MRSSPPVIAVINSNDDTVDMLRVCLQQHGFSAVTTSHVEEIKAGRLDFPKFIAEHDPDVIIWDISIPYDDNWRFLELMRTSDTLRGRPVVVTTTNKRALDGMVGETAAIEIIGKPYDLDAVVAAVRQWLPSDGRAPGVA